ncbi:MAG: hypothetical protein J7M24_07940 [Candidatus Latescibacteria bacterium]|nr:hypothetical protein [Candidatus Latescibacterota bacterium]
MCANETGKLPHLADLIPRDDHDALFSEIERTIASVRPAVDFDTLETVFRDIIRLYNGEYPGFSRCRTEYHDLRHTLFAFVAMSRLMHGYIVAGESITERSVLLGLISALMHDTGYIQTDDDHDGTGAKYTLKHIARSIHFMQKYFIGHGFSSSDYTFCKHCILCTNINAVLDEIDFSTEEEATVGKMLGISDLISQTSDRSYLEKLIFLYLEFVEGNVQGFANELDLLTKTIGFFDFTLKRFATEFDSLNEYMIHHFRARYNIDADLYFLAIKKNLSYLTLLMDNNRGDFHNYLRRDGILDKLSGDEHLAILD